MNRMKSAAPAAAPSCALGAALAVAILPHAAFAEEYSPADGSDRPDIVVIGEPEPDANPNANPDAPYKIEKSQDGKFTEPLRDTPKSVTAIPKEVIEDIGATSFREVVRSTPGVTLGTGEGGNAFGDRIFIRGFEARNDVYVDGLRDPGVTSREIFAVEQIEVIKGPSGTFGGRGTTGGLVSLQSKRPQFGKNFVVVEAGVGSADYWRGTLDANYEPADGLGLRVSALYHNSDTPGRDYVGSERWGVAASALWEPTETLRIVADYYGFRLDGMSDYGHPFDVTTQRPFAVNADNFYGAVGRDFLDNGSDVGTLTVRFEPTGQITLRSSVRYGKTWNYYVVSVPRAPREATIDDDGFTPGQLVVDTGTPQRHGDNETFAALFDATLKFDTGGIGHTVVAGMELAHEKVSNRRYAYPETVEGPGGDIIATPGGFTRDLFDPDPVLGFRIPAVLDSNSTPTTVDVDTMAAYLIDTIRFSPQWLATLGLRFDTFDVRARGANRNGTTFDRSQSIEFINGQASLLYKPAEPVSIYASFSTSSNPSGEQLDSIGADYGGLADGLEGLKPERNKAYEFGVKYEVNPTLLVSAAIFQIDKSNAREQVAPGEFALVGELRSRGAEISVSGNITPRWSVFGGLTYLDAEITDSTDPGNIGSRFPNVPRYNLSLLSNYRVTDWLAVGGQAYYQSNLHGGTYASTTATVPGYWRFDATARIRPTSNSEVRLNVLNIGDRRYYDAIYRSSAPFAYVAPGRSATLTFALKY